MSTPQFKQQHLTTISDQRRQALGRAAPGPTAGQPGPSRHAAALAALVVLVAGGLFTVDMVGATADCTGVNGTEDFETYTANVVMPPNCLLTQNNANGFVVVSPVPPGSTRAWSNNNQGALASAAGLVHGGDPCSVGTAGAPITYSFDFYLTAFSGSAGDYTGVFSGVGTIDNSIAGLGVGTGGQVYAVLKEDRPTVASNSGTTAIAGAIASINTWYSGFYTIDDTATGSTCDMTLTAGINIGGTLYQVSTTTAGDGNSVGGLIRMFTFQSGPATEANVGVAYIDNIQISGYPFTPTNSQVAVTALTGYSMDSTGRQILVRTNSGALIESYAVGTLIQSGTFATPNCSRFDGVLSVEVEDEIYNVFVDCDGSGDSNAFKIRNAALGTPDYGDGQFGDDCSQTQDDNVQDLDTPIPNEFSEIGQLLQFPLNFNRCDNGPTGFDYAATALTFSEINGRLGVLGVLYEVGQDDFDKADVLLDTDPTPQINQFCSWHNFHEDAGENTIGSIGSNENDPSDANYVAGVADTGPTGVYQVGGHIDSTGNPVQAFTIDVSMKQRFLNNGQFGSGKGIACAGDTIAILKSSALYVLDGVLNGTPTIRTGYPIPITSTLNRGIAITGSERFISYIDSGTIHTIWANNGTATSVPYTMPTGAFHGMVYDNSGEHLAVFTSTFITIYQTSEITCELSNSCAAESGVGSDDNPTGGSSTTSTGGAGGGGNFADELLGNPYFWVLLWILIINVVIAALSWGTRAGFPGLVYGIATLIVYIFGVLLTKEQSEPISPWPIVAIIAVIIGLTIAKFRN